MRKISLNWDVQLDKILGKVGDINKKKTQKQNQTKKLQEQSCPPPKYHNCFWLSQFVFLFFVIVFFSIFIS